VIQIIQNRKQNTENTNKYEPEKRDNGETNCIYSGLSTILSVSQGSPGSSRGISSGLQGSPRVSRGLAASYGVSLGLQGSPGDTRHLTNGH